MRVYGRMPCSLACGREMQIARWLCLRITAWAPVQYETLIEVLKTRLGEEKNKRKNSAVVLQVNDGVDDYDLSARQIQPGKAQLLWRSSSCFWLSELPTFTRIAAPTIHRTISAQQTIS
jgi:hypothetical protein